MVHGELHSASHLRWELEPSAASGLPLPKGESWGEGEGTVHQPIAPEASRHLLQSKVHGKSQVDGVFLKPEPLQLTSLKFDIWNFSGAWILVIGASSVFGAS
jgi:hypothetical protein